MVTGYPFDLPPRDGGNLWAYCAMVRAADSPSSRRSRGGQRVAPPHSPQAYHLPLIVAFSQVRALLR